MFRTSAIPTKSELAAIRFSIAQNFAVTTEGNRVLLTLNQFNSRPPVPLVTWAFTPGTAPDFAGTLLPNAVIDAGNMAKTGYASMQEGLRFSRAELEEFGRSIAVDVQRLVLAGGELRCEYVCLHTDDPCDWVR